jgi:hypothetical protein
VKQNYFIYNDVRYEEGTIVIIARFDVNARRVCDTKAKFVYYDTETKEYYFDIYGKLCSYTEERFKIIFRNIYTSNKINDNKLQQTEKAYSFSDELNIDGMFIAWIWYIFIMAIGTIFKGNIIIWAWASYVFFNYRNKKLR